MTIIVIGAGFAGRAAVGKIKSLPGRKILIDKSSYTTMLPSLPDIAAGCIMPQKASASLESLIPPGIEVVRGQVTSIDFAIKHVTTTQGVFEYDFLVLACGSKTEFHGFNQNLDKVYGLDGIDAAVKMRNEFNSYLQTASKPRLVVAGGGYTGIEIAGALFGSADRQNKELEIIIIQRGHGVLPFLQGKQHSYVHRHLEEMKVKIVSGAVVENFDGNTVVCSNGDKFEDAFLCWAAGSTLSVEQINGDFEQIRDGRIKVDAFLRAEKHKDVFVVGDCAAIEAKGQWLRKAVNFSIYTGVVAGDNVCRSVRGEILRRYEPVDLGWVIPFGHFSIGKIFGVVPVFGRLGLFLHYVMCGLRNFNISNAVFYFKTAFRQLFAKRRNS